MQVKTCDVVYDDSIRCRMLDLRCRTNIRHRMAAMSYVLRHRRGTMSYVHDVRHRVQHRYYTMSYVWRTTSYVGKNPDGTWRCTTSTGNPSQPESRLCQSSTNCWAGQLCSRYVHVSACISVLVSESCQYHASDMPLHVCHGVDIQWLLEKYTKNV
jgi:hypothetical protein